MAFGIEFRRGNNFIQFLRELLYGNMVAQMCQRLVKNFALIQTVQDGGKPLVIAGFCIMGNHSL